jgi:hypothetical protein
MAGTELERQKNKATEKNAEVGVLLTLTKHFEFFSATRGLAVQASP